MKFTHRPDNLFEQTLSRIPAEVRSTFTPTQLDAMQLALGSTTYKRHRIDLRPSLSIGGRGLYLVLLAGVERRSPKRPRKTGSSYRYDTLLSISVSAMVLGMLAMITLLPMLQPSRSKAQPYPTAIPWLQTEASCEDSGRSWQDETCWDSIHSPDF